MEEITFTCRTVTPLFMSGADGKIAELRPPGIKASLRFWWRALHGHLSLNELKKLEGKIFGDNKQRSNLLIRANSKSQDLQEGLAQLLPHRSNRTDPAFSDNSVFTLDLKFTEGELIEGNNTIPFNREYIKNIFVLSCILGGWGKRSRRGFGSIAITKIDNEEFTMPTTLSEIFNDYFQKIVQDKFDLERDKITAKQIEKNNSEEYPRVLSVQIGQNKKTLGNIGKATHDIKGQNKWVYQFSVGDGRNRLASPVYISLLPNGKPIISTLKTQMRKKKVKDRNGNFKEINAEIDTVIQEKLKNEILR